MISVITTGHVVRDVKTRRPNEGKTGDTDPETSTPHNRAELTSHVNRWPRVVVAGVTHECGRILSKLSFCSQ